MEYLGLWLYIRTTRQRDTQQGKKNDSSFFNITILLPYPSRVYTYNKIHADEH